MIQDIKVDIVYYMTATDFEFEFNLGGCCHMRLLTDKAKDKKGFVNALARAVSRSRVIISCGPLFGEDGLIAVTATSIGHGLVLLDNKAYGVASAEQIEIISGSVPLVTSEGYFGGCIIESGSQSIVILTENRTIRKQIMKNLIHPYIADISIMKPSERADILPEPVKPTEENKIVEEVIFEDDGAEEETEGLPSKEDKEYIFEDENADDTPDYDYNDDIEHNIEFDYTFGDDEPSSKEPETALKNEPIGDNALFTSDYDKNSPKKKKVKNGLNISIIVIAAVLLLLILALCWFLVIVPARNGISTAEYMSSLFGESSSAGLV